MRNKMVISMILLIYIVASAGTASAGNAASGDGTMVVSPNSVTVSSTGNSLSFTFTAQNGKDFNSGSQATILVPAGWTAPQKSNSANPGYISVVAGSPACTVLSIGTITGTGPWTIPINMVCSGGKSFILIYAGGGTKVTAPTTTGLNTFTTKTKKSGGTLTAISTSPTVNVKASTSTTVTSSVNPSVFGNSVTFTASVLPYTASGTVQFTIDGSNFGSAVTLSGGSATSSATSSLSVGNHPVTAVYSGDGNNYGNTGTLIGGQTVTSGVGKVEWQPKRQGTNDGKLDEIDCLESKPGEMQWNFNPADLDADPILILTGSLTGTYALKKPQTGDVYKFITPYTSDLNNLYAEVQYDGDASGATLKISHGCSGRTEVPEFPTIALPIAAVIGLVFFFQNRKKKEE